MIRMTVCDVDVAEFAIWRRLLYPVDKQSVLLYGDGRVHEYSFIFRVYLALGLANV